MWWNRKQQDFNAEIEAHIELEADRLREDGVSPDEALSAARRAFGNRTLAEERFYEAQHWVFLDNLVRDLRFAARVLRKDARFSLLAILGLGLGIGLSTAIFALINDEIRALSAAGETDPSYVGLPRVEKGRARTDAELSYSDYRYYLSHSTVFRDIRVESGRFRFIVSSAGSDGSGTVAEDAQGRFVSANFLSASGLHPSLGRSFSAAEEEIGGPPVAMLTYAYWKAHFAEDPGVLGRTLLLNAHAITIVGVAPPPYGAGDSDFVLPMVLHPVLFPGTDFLRDVNQRWLLVDAWLRPGMAASQAQAQIDVLSGNLGKKNEGVRVSPGGPNPQKKAEMELIALATILSVSMILLIACTNLANLLLARAVVRRREIGVRLSLGASRARLICQLLTESLLLSAAGGALGLIFAYWLAQSLLAQFTAGPATQQLHMDLRVVLYVVALAVATGLSFGLAPALAATKINLAQALHSEGLASASRGRSLWSPRNGLVSVPLTVSLMLLLGAGMTIHMIRGIYRSTPTFDASRLISMSFRLNLQGYNESRTLLFQENLSQRAATIPGVASVALATSTPLSNGSGWFPMVTEGSPVSTDDASLHAGYNVISPGFFDTVGTPVVRGRAFAASDRAGSPPVVMVNQDLVRRYWPGENPIGKRIRLGSAGTFAEVVGVAPDFEDAETTFSSVRPTIYVPFEQAKLFFAGAKLDTPAYQTQILVRATADPAPVKTALRQEVLAADPTLRVTLQTVQEMTEARVGPVKTITLLLGALGALALLMASVGIYAVLSYAVSQKTREIGIRMALGAQRGEILASMMRRTIVLIVWGIGFGLLGALVLNRVFSRSLRKLGELDAVTCISVAILLGAVALLASYLPARKALRVDPVQALRCE